MQMQRQSERDTRSKIIERYNVDYILLDKRGVQAKPAITCLNVLQDYDEYDETSALLSLARWLHYCSAHLPSADWLYRYSYRTKTPRRQCQSLGKLGGHGNWCSNAVSRPLHHAHLKSIGMRRHCFDQDLASAADSLAQTPRSTSLMQ